MNFEFVKAQGVNKSSTQIAINKDSTAQEVAVLIKNAINSVTDLRITATIPSDNPTKVNLVNIRTNQKNVQGNQRIVWSINSAALVTKGMEGGADACIKGTKCKQNADCQNGVCTSSGKCN